MGVVFAGLQMMVEWNLKTVSLNWLFPSLVTGDNYSAQQLAVLCGRDVPGPIRSTGEFMYIRFISDSSVTRAGFNASVHKSNEAKHLLFDVLTTPLSPFSPSFFALSSFLLLLFSRFNSFCPLLFSMYFSLFPSPPLLFSSLGFLPNYSSHFLIQRHKL